MVVRVLSLVLELAVASFKLSVLIAIDFPLFGLLSCSWLDLFDFVHCLIIMPWIISVLKLHLEKSLALTLRGHESCILVFIKSC